MENLALAIGDIEIAHIEHGRSSLTA
jgi:hypothetical protein